MNHSKKKSAALKGRILCLTSNFPRWKGDSTTPFVLHLAQDLKRLGWKVDVLAPHAPDTARREKIGGVQVERFQYLWPAGAETVCYQGGALINLRKNRKNLLKLPALVAAEWTAVLNRLAVRRYDLLHSHWILPQGFVGALSAGLMGTPHVVTVHGGDVFALNGGLLQRFKRFALGAANAVTVNSSVTEKAVRSIHGDIKNLNRIPMGVDIIDVGRQSHSVQAIRRQYRRGNGPLLVFVGRIVEEKGIGDIIEATDLLKTKFPDITALIVGEGQQRKHFEKYTADKNLSRHVLFTGWVQPKDILYYLAAADIFVGPSRTAGDGWVEAQGLTFLEAMVARTPVIASRIGGIVDSVKHEKTGLLVDENSPGQIAEAVERIIAQPNLKKNIVKNGYDLSVKNFSRNTSAVAFSNLFSRLIKQTKDIQP